MRACCTRAVCAVHARSDKGDDEAEHVLAEDTRVSRKLLTHHGVDTPLAALHAHTGFFCHMCAFAWTDITPTLAAITLPKGPFKPHEIPVTPAEEPGSPPQRGEGMGAPFGLSVPVEAQVAL